MWFCNYLHAVIWLQNRHLLWQQAFVLLPPFRFLHKQIYVWCNLLQFRISDNQITLKRGKQNNAEPKMGTWKHIKSGLWCLIRSPRASILLLSSISSRNQTLYVMILKVFLSKWIPRLAVEEHFEFSCYHTKPKWPTNSLKQKQNAQVKLETKWCQKT